MQRISVGKLVQVMANKLKPADSSRSLIRPILNYIELIEVRIVCLAVVLHCFPIIASMFDRWVLVPVRHLEGIAHCAGRV